jgi:hypothetical protein
VEVLVRIVVWLLIHQYISQKERQAMGLLNFVRQKIEERKINRTLSEVFPDFRPETPEDKERVEQHRDAITDTVMTDQWRVYAVRGHQDVYHISPDEGYDYIVRLTKGLCLVEATIEITRQIPLAKGKAVRLLVHHYDSFNSLLRKDISHAAASTVRWW